MTIKSPVRIASIAAILAAATLSASADDAVVASLPFNWDKTAGPSCTDYLSNQDALDTWVLEDFGLDSDTALSRFETMGMIYPEPTVVYEVTVRIYDAFPPEGNIVMSSIPGEGTFESADGFSIYFVTDFGGQVLPAGDYWLAWTVATNTDLGKIAIDWATPGEHKVGGGLPDNGWQWNPAGGRGWEDNLRAIPEDLDGNGRIGVNFSLFGRPQDLCEADFDGSGTLDLFDFLAFVNAFNGGEERADCTADGAFDLFDFLCFVNAFNQGC
jgi:hypothetical protein